ncbi:hypothetical protein CALCODRAFT_511222 [Calocera cornea HHB12733]|uniref:Uncharacterized protein n=1 Tax=Calocera cornea HHB12733 TaxID=1353952 RepID=A0A165DXF0_9BASI|nr:hypothetical protein CALCODRAFT_511222 [Calocera cornea HHB12733]
MPTRARESDFDFVIEHPYSTGSWEDGWSTPRSLRNNPMSHGTKSPTPFPLHHQFFASPHYQHPGYLGTPPPRYGGSPLHIPHHQPPEERLTISPDELTHSLSTRSGTVALPETPPAYEAPLLAHERLQRPLQTVSAGKGTGGKMQEQPAIHGLIVEAGSNLQKRSWDDSGLDGSVIISNKVRNRGSFSASRNWEGSGNMEADEIVQLFRDWEQQRIAASAPPLPVTAASAPLAAATASPAKVRFSSLSVCHKTDQMTEERPRGAYPGKARCTTRRGRR